MPADVTTIARTAGPLQRLSAIGTVWAIALSYVGVELAVSGRYGYFRDEFYYLACARHLAWGYVDHPPGVAAIAWLSRALFGESLLGIRFLSAVAGGTTILLAGRLARVLGGDRWAGTFAALAVAVTPVFHFLFHILSMNAWDILLWTAVCLLVAEIAATDRAVLWLWVGVLVGLGLEIKHSMAFLVFGLGVGVVLTTARRWLRDWHLWSGGLITIAIAAPNIWWEIAHGWPTLEFARNAAADKNAMLSPLWFVGEQLLQAHPLNLLLLVAGLWFFFTAEQGRFRLFGWAYLAMFALLVAQHGKPYYIAPIYPLMFAAGAVVIAREALTASGWRWAAVTVLLVTGVAAAPFTLPVLPITRYVAYATRLGIMPDSGERMPVGVLPQHYADMFGWDDIVSTVARVYRDLPPPEQAHAGVFALNYGDAGAIDLLGPRYGLPVPAMSRHNNYFYWGPDQARMDVLIVIGGRIEDHQKSYADVRVAATIECGLCMPYENHRRVYVLRQRIRPVQEIWLTSKLFI